MLFITVFDVCGYFLFFLSPPPPSSEGVLLCRGNSLLTGSNTHWLRLWEVESVRRMKPLGKVPRKEGFVAPPKSSSDSHFSYPIICSLTSHIDKRQTM